MFQRVETAMLAPRGCMICGGTKNLLDLMQEFSPAQLRLYLCEIHGKEIAKAYGFAPGPEQEALLRVRDTLIAKEREHAELGARFEALRQDMTGLLDRYEQLQAERDLEHGRAEQLQAQLDKVREDTMATLAATAVPEPEPDYEPALD